jgi:integrase
MSRQSKGARLWLEPERTENGRLRKRAVWVIRDGARKIGTGCARGDREGAERALGKYIASKYQPSKRRDRDPAETLVLDVLNLYLTEVAPKHKRPEETKQRILKLADFWQPYTLDDITGDLCRNYVKWRVGQQWKSSKPEKTDRPARTVTEASARRELEDLRAAINHHVCEGRCSRLISIVLPEKSEPRPDWLTRSKAARLIWAAWRAKQIFQDQNTQRDVGKHIARFVLVGLYTGSRHAAICGAAFHPAIGRGYVDLKNGMFYRRAKEVAETKKRQPSIRLPGRLLAHLRRWQRLGISTHSVIEWNGKPVRSVRKGFASAVRVAGLEKATTPHILRHTAATWAMQNGGDIWQIAGYLGMTVETLQTVYGHHHPDYQEDAMDAITGRKKSRRQNGDRMGVNKSGQTRTNATKNAAFSRGAG